MPPRAISSPSQYRAVGFDTTAGMPTPPARSVAASGSSVVAAESLVRGRSSRGYSGMTVPSPKLQTRRVATTSLRDERDRLVERCSARMLGRYRDVLVPDRHAAVEDKPVRR